MSAAQNWNCINLTEFQELTAANQQLIAQMCCIPGQLLGGSGETSFLTDGMVFANFNAPSSFTGSIYGTTHGFHYTNESSYPRINSFWFCCHNRYDGGQSAYQRNGGDRATGARSRVERVVSCVDCGHVVNPLTVAMQIESAVLYGLTAALYHHSPGLRRAGQFRFLSDRPHGRRAGHRNPFCALGRILQRRRADALARDGEDGVGDRGGDRRGAGFADPAPFVAVARGLRGPRASPGS